MHTAQLICSLLLLLLISANARLTARQRRGRGLKCDPHCADGCRHYGTGKCDGRCKPANLYKLDLITHTCPRYYCWVLEADTQVHADEWFNIPLMPPTTIKQCEFLCNINRPDCIGFLYAVATQIDARADHLCALFFTARSRFYSRFDTYEKSTSGFKVAARKAPAGFPATGIEGSYDNVPDCKAACINSATCKAFAVHTKSNGVTCFTFDATALPLLDFYVDYYRSVSCSPGKRCGHRTPRHPKIGDCMRPRMRWRMHNKK